MKKEQKPKVIMTVEDHKDTREAIRLILSKEGYEVLEAESGNGCLETLYTSSLKKQLPDLILMDIMMHGMTGWDTVTEIRKNKEWDKIKICFLSVVEVSDERKKALKNSGIQGYLMKPCGKDCLLTEVRRLLK